MDALLKHPFGERGVGEFDETPSRVYSAFRRSYNYDGKKISSLVF